MYAFFYYYLAMIAGWAIAVGSSFVLPYQQWSKEMMASWLFAEKITNFQLLFGNIQLGISLVYCLIYSELVRCICNTFCKQIMVDVLLLLNLFFWWLLLAMSASSFDLLFFVVLTVILACFGHMIRSYYYFFR